jgi:hypothetical protein
MSIVPGNSVKAEIRANQTVKRVLIRYFEVLKISEYVTLSAERKCHPLANHPTTAS